MDSDEIAHLVHKLELSQVKEKAQVTLSPDLSSLGRQRLESCLVGKVFSSRAVNRETFRANMPRILQAKKSIDIEMVGENLFSLDFNSPVDKRRALVEGPWNFFKDLVIFAEPKGLQNPNDMAFTEIPIWVQLHNLPIAFMHPTILRNLGSKIGKVIEVEIGERGTCSGKFARIRVMKNIVEPLEKGIFVKITESEEESCILLLYEKLPNFCFACGRLGHFMRDCEDSTVDKNSLEFGNWMRAPSAPIVRRSGTSRNIKSDSSVPSGEGDAFEDPSDSNPENFSPSLEILLSNSIEGEQSGIKVGELAADKMLLDVVTVPLALTESNRALGSEDGILDEQQILQEKIPVNHVASEKVLDKGRGEF